MKKLFVLLLILTLLLAAGCRDVTWMFPEETGFYQPIVTARMPCMKVDS